MKIKDPFGYEGWLEVEAQYKIAGRVYGFDLDSKGSATNKQSLKWDSFNLIETFFNVEYKLMVPINRIIDLTPFEGMGVGRFGITADWAVAFSGSDVKLTQDGVQPRDWGQQKHDGEINVAASVRLWEGETGKKPAVQMVVNILAGHEKDGMVQIGLQKGPISAGISIGGSKGSGKDEMSLKLILDMERPAVAPPKMEIPKIPRSLAEPDAIYFEEGEFTLERDSLKALEGWVGKVKDHDQLRTVILLGEVPLDIQGFASTTGPKDKKTPKEKFNKELSEKRVDSVVRILKSKFNSSTIKFDKKGHGMSKAEGEGKKYNFNRRAEIKFDVNAAYKAIERVLKKP